MIDDKIFFNQMMKLKFQVLVFHTELCLNFFTEPIID